MHEGGLKVYTTLDVDLQRAANQAVLDGLAAYERRHGWKGHLENVVAEGMVLDKYFHPDWDDEPEVNGYIHSLVTSAGTGIATLKFGRYLAAIGQADVAWTGQKLADILKTETDPQSLGGEGGEIGGWLFQSDTKGRVIDRFDPDE